MAAARKSISHDSRFDALESGREIMHAESRAIAAAALTLNQSFTDAVEKVVTCRGRIAVTGVGKSSDIGLKCVGTLNSTGTRAYHLDATKAVHGDLGMVDATDIAILLSHSGESEEIVRLLGPLKKLAGLTIAITGKPHSTLATAVDLAIVYGPLTEACPNSLAPSTSTTVTLAICDALALTVSKHRQFTVDDFAKYHPAGNLGRKLATVAQLMRTGSELRIAREPEPLRIVFGSKRSTGRRTGAVMIVNDQGHLTGIFTDSDLARLFESKRDDAFDRPIGEVMTRNPMSVMESARLTDAVDLLRGKKISELPILNRDGEPVGMLDITDVIGTESPRPGLRVAG
jgi:arabinose-5-phosphate isomerase